MPKRRALLASCAVAVSVLASCSLVTDIPDLTGGTSDGGAADAATACPPHVFTYDPKGRALTTVHVSGSFNGWPKTIAAGGWPLAKNGAIWTLTHVVPNGHYSYKLVLNESEWITDPTDPKSEPDGLGNTNSVLDVVCGADH